MENINPEKYYSVAKLASMKILPWASPMTLRKRLKNDKWNNIFKPIIEEKEGKLFMFVKGENIINFLTMANNGQL